LIVVDASALVAIGALEPDVQTYLEALSLADGAFLTPVNYVETGVVLIGRDHMHDRRQLDKWLSSLNVELREDTALGTAALDAYRKFGRGYHPAKLNLSDCFAYALAKQLGAPLLYKGDDFAKTDIRSALQPT
jgi:ribonuclease VapC